MLTTNNLFNHKQTPTFEGYTTFASCYMLHIAKRAAAASVRAAYHKSGQPFMYELLNATIHGEGIGEDILQEAFIAVWNVAESNPTADYSFINEEGRKAVYTAVRRYIYGERKRANIADIAALEGLVEDITLRLEGYTMTEDIIRTIAAALPKNANKGLYCRIIARVLEGESRREIAAAEGISLRRVQVIIERGRDILIENGYTTANINKAH